MLIVNYVLYKPTICNRLFLFSDIYMNQADSPTTFFKSSLSQKFKTLSSSKSLTMKVV